MNAGSFAIVFLAVGIVWILMQFVIVPFIRVEIRRKQAAQHRPQPEEIWAYDGGMLYIDRVDEFGVEVIMPRTGGVDRWKDSWPEWHTRIRMRGLWFTGAKRPLGTS